METTLCKSWARLLYLTEVRGLRGKELCEKFKSPFIEINLPFILMITNTGNQH